jgi:hypothetical protein
MKAIILIAMTITMVYTQTCLNTVPTKKEDCTSKSDSEYCCYLWAPNLKTGNSNKCYSIPKTSLNSDPTISYNGVTYYIDCGVKVQESNLPTCGPSDPSGKKDCMTGATFTNSCCWNNDKKKCFSLGTKYTGDIRWAELDLDCSAADISVSLMILFAILSIIF